MASVALVSKGVLSAGSDASSWDAAPRAESGSAISEVIGLPESEIIRWSCHFLDVSVIINSLLRPRVTQKDPEGP